MVLFILRSPLKSTDRKTNEQQQQHQYKFKAYSHTSIECIHTLTIAFMLAHLHRNLIKIAYACWCTSYRVHEVFSFFFFFFYFCFIIPLLRLDINAMDFVCFLSCLVDISAAVVAVDTLIVLAVIVIGAAAAATVYFLSSSQTLMLMLHSFFQLFLFIVFLHSNLCFHTQHVLTHVVL